MFLHVVTCTKEKTGIERRKQNNRKEKNETEQNTKEENTQEKER